MEDKRGNVTPGPFCAFQDKFKERRHNGASVRTAVARLAGLRNEPAGTIRHLSPPRSVPSSNQQGAAPAENSSAVAVPQSPKRSATDLSCGDTMRLMVSP